MSSRTLSSSAGPLTSKLVILRIFVYLRLRKLCSSFRTAEERVDKILTSPHRVIPPLSFRPDNDLRHKFVWVLAAGPGCVTTDCQETQIRSLCLSSSYFNSLDNLPAFADPSSISINLLCLFLFWKFKIKSKFYKSSKKNLSIDPILK